MSKVGVIVRTGITHQVVLVLDPSAGNPQWQTMTDLLTNLLGHLPQTALPRIYFFGNQTEYRAADFNRNGRTWYEENRFRVRLLSPVYNALGRSTAGPILVFTAGRIFDVEDWLDTPLLQRTHFVRCSANAQGNRGMRPEYDPLPEALRRRAHEPNLDELRRLVHDPIVQVKVSCSHGMPFFWDNPVYRLEGTTLIGGAAAGALDQPAPDVDTLNVGVEFLTGPPGQPSAVATLQSGEHCELTVEPASLTSEPWWQPLPDDEAARFRQCVTSKRYTCHKCHSLHRAQSVFCEKDQENHVLCPTLVYPSLEKTRGRGFVLLRDSSEGVQARHHACAALLLDSFHVAVRDGNNTKIYTCNPPAREWECGADESLEPYRPLTCKRTTTYAIYL
jgi:hypothetical protein